MEICESKELKLDRDKIILTETTKGETSMKKGISLFLTITLLFMGVSIATANDNDLVKPLTKDNETQNIATLTDDNAVYDSEADEKGIMKSNTSKRVMIGLAAIAAAVVAAAAGGGGGGGGH